MRNTDFSYDKISVLSNDEDCGILPGERLNTNVEHNNYDCVAELAKEFIRKNFTSKIKS